MRYSHTGGGDSPSCTIDISGTVLERSVGLPGGVSLTVRADGTQVWSYPNIHGDVTAVTNIAGVKQGATKTYDPYGNALGDLPENSAGNFDYGWLGQHKRGLEHENGLIPIIQMGARQYDPRLGRFLEIDPVEGGNANDWVYPTDPVNQFDLDGNAQIDGASLQHHILKAKLNAKAKRIYRSMNSLRGPDGGRRRSVAPRQIPSKDDVVNMYIARGRANLEVAAAARTGLNFPGGDALLTMADTLNPIVDPIVNVATTVATNVVTCTGAGSIGQASASTSAKIASTAAELAGQTFKFASLAGPTGFLVACVGTVGLKYIIENG